TQELALQVQRYLADLVEEQGTPIRCLETAQSILERAGKRPLHVTEKLALIEFLGNGGAVHSNQRLIRAQASLVNFLRNQFLTRACFSKDHYRRIRRRNSPNAIQDCFQRTAFSQDVNRIIDGLQFGRIARRDRLLDGIQEVVGLEWLG